MHESVAGVAFGDAGTGPSRDAAEVDGVPRCVPKDRSLLQRPAGLDWVEVGGIRRPIDDADAVASGTLERPGVTVAGREVVHDEHVAGLEPRQPFTHAWLRPIARLRSDSVEEHQLLDGYAQDPGPEGSPLRYDVGLLTLPAACVVLP
jgi:hypothetical protein